MKKFSLAAAVSSLFLAVNGAFAHDVVLDFTGKVTQATCKIEGAAEGGQLTKLVALSDVSTNALSKAGDVAGLKVVTINLGGCTGSKVEAKFNYLAGAIDINTGAIKNSLSTADNGADVQVQLLDSEYQPIKLGAENTPVAVTQVGEEAVVGFYAQYLAATGPATAGDFKSQIMLDFSYE
ncbi:type 1 fimbrial protein [Pseudomonas sp. MWU12-2534b]|nr:type 1 fimbrial protein [Pseudomonas sp. MWU12-2534b]